MASDNIFQNFPFANYTNKEDLNIKKVLNLLDK